MSGEKRPVLIFGGTTEGRQIAQILAKNKISCVLCVATEYGWQVVENSALSKDELALIHIRTGRLDKNQMENLAETGGYSAVVDATHPFAAEATRNIRGSFCGKTNVIRLERNLSHIEGKNLKYFSNAPECEAALEKFIEKNPDARIFLTTGSKDLHIFCRNENLRRHLVARVLPSLESVKICADNGLEGSQIIAMQGPFSEKMNKAQIQDFKISLLVTKESGRAGGTDEKIAAAKNCGIKCFVIKKTAVSPAETDGTAAENCITTASVHETLEKLSEVLNQKIEASCKLKIFLCGTGMGSRKNLTREVEDAIQNADFIFGAPRMIEKLEAAAQKFPFYLAKDIIPILEKKRNESADELNVPVLLSGDAGFFSGAAKLRRELKNIGNVEVKILPGVSSLSYLSAKCGISYENARIVSAHGVDEKIWKSEMIKILENFTENDKIFFLTSGAEDVRKIGETVKFVKNSRQIESDFKIVLGFNLSYDDEKIMELSPAECDKINKAGLYSGFILRAGE